MQHRAHALCVAEGAATSLAESQQEILAGLTARQKRLSPRFLYDERGSELFDEICALPEYYQTRTELALLHDHAADIAALAVTHGYDPCNGIEGRFEIQEIEYGPGVEIASLRATFEQRCAGSTAAVRGELRWHYDAPVVMNAPAVVDVEAGNTILVGVSATTTGTVATLTATDLPEGAVFTDSLNNTGGLLVFTVEALVAPPAGVPYRIETHGRYSHAESYVAGVLRDAGFSPEISHADLRTESALAVAGLVVRATKLNGQDDASHL